MALVPMLAGSTIGAASSLGAFQLMQLAADLGKFQLPQVVKDFAPLAGAGLAAGVEYLSGKFRDMVVPTLIGGGLMWGLQMFLSRQGAKGYRQYMGGAAAYNRLRGSGNVTRTLNAGAQGAGNVTRTLSAVA